MRRGNHHTNRASARQVLEKQLPEAWHLGRLHRISILGWCMCILWSPHSDARDAVDLPEAVQYALLQNRDLNQTRLAIDSSMYALDAAESKFTFEVQPDGSALTTQDRDVFAVGLNIDKKTVLGTEFSAGARYSRIAENLDDERPERSSVRFQVSQPLLRAFGTLVNREQIVQA